MKLVWNEVELGWVCERCGAIYDSKEVERSFEYKEQTSENFNGGYCMDCGVFWKSVTN